MHLVCHCHIAYPVSLRGLSLMKPRQMLWLMMIQQMTLLCFYLLIIWTLWRSNLVQNVSPPLRHAGLQAAENSQNLLTNLEQIRRNMIRNENLKSVVLSIFCRFCPIPVIMQLVWPTLSHVLCLDLWPSELDNWNDGEPAVPVSSDPAPW